VVPANSGQLAVMTIYLSIPPGGEKVQSAVIDLTTASALLWASRCSQVR
jgi:hypothetical protein